MEMPDFRTRAPEYVSIVGSRKLPHPAPVWEWMAENIDPLRHVVVTGDADGADRYAREYCSQFGVLAVIVPARHLWQHYHKAGGMIRNPIVVRLSSNLVVAFPYEKSNGTYDATTFAQKIGKRVRFPVGGGTDQPDIFESLEG